MASSWSILSLLERNKDESKEKKRASTPDAIDEDGKDGGGWGQRHILSFLSFLVLAIGYLHRNCLNIAIVAMVGTKASNNTSNSSDICPAPLAGNYSSIQEEGEFDWDERKQGLLLGCFFYGYAASTFAGGLAAEYFGGRMVLGVGVFFTSVLSILSPICARTSFPLIVAVRILSGLAQGPLYPALYSLMATWIPSQERGTISSFIFTGSHFGIVTAMGLGGIMASSDFLGGWPSIFYVFGAVGLLWCVAWFIMVRDNPENHPIISASELQYLQEKSATTKSTGKKISIPWREVLKSAPFLCLIVALCGDGIGYYTFQTVIPTYLSKIQNFDLTSNGLVTALPFLCLIVFSPLYGSTMNAMNKKNYLTIKSIRKISTAIALLVPCAGLVAMCFAGCNSTLVVFLLCLSIASNGAKFCGSLIAVQDIAPNFAGALMGIVNTFQSITGILAPMMTGLITAGNQTLSAWQTVFAIAAGCYLIGALSYLIFGTDEVQPWNNPKEEEKNKC